MRPPSGFYPHHPSPSFCFFSPCGYSFSLFSVSLLLSQPMSCAPSWSSPHGCLVIASRPGLRVSVPSAFLFSPLLLQTPLSPTLEPKRAKIVAYLNPSPDEMNPQCYFSNGNKDFPSKEKNHFKTTARDSGIILF